MCAWYAARPFDCSTRVEFQGYLSALDERSDNCFLSFSRNVECRWYCWALQMMLDLKADKYAVRSMTWPEIIELSGDLWIVHNHDYFLGFFFDGYTSGPIFHHFLSICVMHKYSNRFSREMAPSLEIHVSRYFRISTKVVDQKRIDSNHCFYVIALQCDWLVDVDKNYTNDCAQFRERVRLEDNCVYCQRIMVNAYCSTTTKRTHTEMGFNFVTYSFDLLFG